jgi:hypothetical protein
MYNIEYFEPSDDKWHHLGTPLTNKSDIGRSLANYAVWMPTETFRVMTPRFTAPIMSVQPKAAL